MEILATCQRKLREKNNYVLADLMKALMVS